MGVSPDTDGNALLAAVDEHLAEAAEVRAEADADSNEIEPAEPITKPKAALKPPPGLALVDEPTLAEVRNRVSELDSFRAELAGRVGCDPSADAPTILAAVDEALNEIADAAEGVEVINTAELAELRNDAEQHRNAREYALVDNAVRDGRLRPFEREQWVEMLRTTPAAVAVLAGLPKGRVPVDGPRGYAGGLGGVGEDPLGGDYDRLFGDS